VFGVLVDEVDFGFMGGPALSPFFLEHVDFFVDVLLAVGVLI
jgi:hypothetical protein